MSPRRKVLGTGLWEGSLCSMVVQSHELIRFPQQTSDDILPELSLAELRRTVASFRLNHSQHAHSGLGIFCIFSHYILMRTPHRKQCCAHCFNHEESEAQRGCTIWLKIRPILSSYRVLALGYSGMGMSLGLGMDHFFSIFPSQPCRMRQGESCFKLERALFWLLS